ncbi:MAG TPA: undecaprenyl/decaprenyl-phosphate alpha-N-acetylglucosaminyl 1-phosphate transferase [Candidatus Desulfofervidus auxilii]|uniref:Undecaprenyl/decaprenyl-phosphate alpha-N-acetylglucosaminyl 1-phosphate transferase n=1 Tax=Desulfofervidus auxilii TaxID=1621989 RepID=A0A7C0U1P6_DESA2|nr:undecaprenyl/decaprenyl-phosphate alpha-N-acetylglucosaminyl 1-phosphate transferase [Candidatus Desulfofervidus auxilii]
MVFLYSFIIAFLITTISIPLFIKVAPKLKLIDVPDERKKHTKPIPKVGGLSLAIGVLLPLLFWARNVPHFWAIFISIFVIFIFGLLDDAYCMSPSYKFLGQILAALIVIYLGGIKINSLGHIIGEKELILGYFSIPLTVFWLVLGTNAINLADGLDGLAAGICLLIFCFICFLAIELGSYLVSIFGFAVCGGLIGFLRYNTFPAIVFLGDTGSQFLGFSASLVTIMLCQNSIYSPVLPILLLGFPLIDTAYVIINRIKQGKSPFKADRSHLHYRLLDIGMSHQESVLTIYILQTIFVCIAFLCRFERDKILFWGYLLFLISFIWLIFTIQRKEIVFPYPKKGFLIHQRFIRTQIANYCAYALFVFLALFYIAMPFFLKDVKKDIGIICGLFLILFFSFLKRKELFSKFIFIVASFFICIYYFYILDFKGITLFQNNLAHLCDIFFFFLAILFIIFLIGTNEIIPITTFDYLVLALAIIIPNVPGTPVWQFHLGKFFAKLIAIYFFLTTFLEKRYFRYFYIFVVLSLLLLLLRSFNFLGYFL